MTTHYAFKYILQNEMQMHAYVNALFTWSKNKLAGMLSWAAICSWKLDYVQSSGFTQQSVPVYITHGCLKKSEFRI